MNIFTIGFAGKSAERFFALLREAGAGRVVDVRLNNRSQLAGFAKRGDLAYFLDALCGIDYVHLPALAPTPDMLAAYRKRRLSWSGYAAAFRDLMDERRIEYLIPREVIAEGCLLCSEDSPDRCHRRLVAEYLADRWGDVGIRHLTRGG